MDESVSIDFSTPLMGDARSAFLRPQRQGPQANSSSHFAGVSLEKSTQYRPSELGGPRWEAHIWSSEEGKGRQIYLGTYHDESLAARCYDRAALAIGKGDTLLNFPTSDYDADALVPRLQQMKDVEKVAEALRASILEDEVTTSLQPSSQVAVARVPQPPQPSPRKAIPLPPQPPPRQPPPQLPEAPAKVPQPPQPPPRQAPRPTPLPEASHQPRMQGSAELLRERVAAATCGATPQELKTRHAAHASMPSANTSDRDLRSLSQHATLSADAFPLSPAALPEHATPDALACTPAAKARSSGAQRSPMCDTITTAAPLRTHTQWRFASAHKPTAAQLQFAHCYSASTSPTFARPAPKRELAVQRVEAPPKKAKIATAATRATAPGPAAPAPSAPHPVAPLPTPTTASLGEALVLPDLLYLGNERWALPPGWESAVFRLLQILPLGAQGLQNARWQLQACLDAQRVSASEELLGGYAWILAAIASKDAASILAALRRKFRIQL